MRAVLPYPVPREKEVRVIILSDVANEADDHAAIVQTLLTPVFDVRGLVAVHFDADLSMERSLEEGRKVLEALKAPAGIVLPGAKGKDDTSSPGADLICREAMRDDVRPLFVLALGALTDVRIALEMDPAVRDRFTLIWIGGEGYPSGGWEYNLSRDAESARKVFSEVKELWQIPRPVYSAMGITLSELYARLRGKGAAADLILDRILAWNMLPAGAYRSGDAWTLGDSPAPGVLIYPHQYCYEVTDRMTFKADLSYIPAGLPLKTRVYRKVYSRLIIEDLFSKTELFSRGLVSFV